VVAIHGRPVLGGNASSEVRLGMAGADRSGNRSVALKTEARESGIVDECRQDQSVANPQYCPEMEDLIFLDKFRAEPNMTLLLNTWMTGVDKTSAPAVSSVGACISTVYATNQITQEQFVVTCSLVIDATGDGRVVAESEADWTQGREASSTYGESNAPPVADTLTEGTSLAFHAVNMGRPMPFKLPPTFTRRF